MRCMIRNKTKFYFAIYVGDSEILDDKLCSTGECESVYSPPIEKFGNISAARGEMQNRQFGESERYDKVIVLDDLGITINGIHTDEFQLDERSILWIDTVPQLNEYGDTDTPHDYVVKRIARSLNGYAITISKVDVT